MPLAHLAEVERRCLERYLAHLVDRLGDDLDEVAVFGSAARGDMWPRDSAMRSDIDLLVITRSPVPAALEQELLDATYPLFLECGRQIGPQFRARDDVGCPRGEAAGRFAGNVAKDAVVLWRRDGR